MADARAKTSKLLGSPLTAEDFEAYSAKLHAYLLRRVRRPQDAPDLTQEIFARFLRKQDCAEVVRDPLSYIFGIAKHVVLEAQSEQRRQRVTYDSPLVDELDESGQFAATEDVAQQLGMREDILGALKKLPENYLAALLLVDGDGMSYEEAAAASGFTRNTIATYLMKARARLKLTLEDYWRQKDRRT